MSDVGCDREIIEILTEVRSGQKYLTISIDEFKKEMNDFKKEIREKVDSHNDEIRDMKSDIRFLKDSTGSNTKDIKQLQDERNVNIVQMGKTSMPGIVKYGIIAFIVISLFSALSTFFIYQNTIQKVFDMQNKGQIQTQIKGGNP